jgi:hypothetical protein
MYNFAPDMCTFTSLSGITGVTPVYSGVVVLGSSALVTVPSGKYYGIELQSDIFPLCKEMRLYVGDSSAYYTNFTYTTLSGQTFSSHGNVNVNTGYCTPVMSNYIKFTDATSSGVYNLLTPQMTGPTAPSPYKVTGDYSSTYYPWQAFDRTTLNNSDVWAFNGAPSVGSPKRLMFSFGAGNAKTVTHYRFTCGSAINELPKDWTLQGTNDPYAVYSDPSTSSKWTTIDTRAGALVYGTWEWTDIFEVASPRPFIAYRLVITANNGSATYVTIGECRFYSTDRIIKSNTLAMVIANSEWGPDSIQAYKAFTQTNTDTSDCWWSRYAPSAGSPKILAVYVGSQGKVINKYALLSRNHSSGTNERSFPRDWTLWGSNTDNPNINTDTEWTLLDTRTSIGDPGQNTWSAYFTFDNSRAFKWYKIKITNRNGTWDNVGIGELKLVEASAVTRSPLLSWTTKSGTWNSQGYYGYTLPTATGIYSVRMFYGNKSRYTQTVSGVQLLSDSQSIVNLSGTITPFTFSFQDTAPQVLSIKNNWSGNAFPKIQPKYTGLYDIDRNIFFSTNYSISGSEGDWIGINSGTFSFPEHYDWSLGTSSGIETYRRSLRLLSTSYSGTWISPVFDCGRDLGSIYAYSTGSTLPAIEVKALETPPPKASFLIITTENTHESLMYKHKRIVIDNNGVVLSWVECNSPYTGNKLWRHADYTFAGSPLNYYGTINQKGTAAFLCPGITTCGDMDPQEAIADQSLWYNLCTSKINDTSKWNMGTTVSGLEWGPKIMVLYTKVFPLEASDAFVVVSITSTTLTETSINQHICVNVAFQDGTETRMTMPVMTLRNTRLTPEDNYDVIADIGNNSWWVYLGGLVSKIYKFDAGSMNSVRIIGGLYVAPEAASSLPDSFKDPDPELSETFPIVDTEGPTDNIPRLDDYLGYLYYLDLEGEYKRIIEIPDPEFRGFWAMTASGITLFEEQYDYGSPALYNRGEVTNSTINSTVFTELHTGACDPEGNLWAVDLTQERLVRVNIKRLQDSSDPNVIDYDNYVDGILGVYPHAQDGLAYVLTSDELDHSQQDVIRMVHAGQSPGARGKYMCTVSGFYSAPYKYGVHFTGNSYTDYYLPYRTDPIWGVDKGNWFPVPNGSTLPQGRFKQFRLKLSRTDLNKTSPILERIRIPQAIVVPPLDKGQTRDIAVRTIFQHCKTYGLFSSKLIIWWTDEEYR